MATLAQNNSKALASLNEKSHDQDAADPSLIRLGPTLLFSARLTFRGSMTRKFWKTLEISIKHDTFESVNSKEAARLDLLVLLNQVSALFRNFLAISENADKQRLPCT